MLDNQSQNCQLFIDRPNQELVRVNGEAIISKSSLRNRDDDKIDIALILLGNETSMNLANTPFLTKGNFDLNYNEGYNKGFISIGFPVSKNKGNIISLQKEAIPYGFWALETDKQNYDQLSFSPSDNIVLDFDGKKVFSEDGEERNAFGLKGLSGAPVWGITASGKCKVVSLLIRHPNKKQVVTSKLGDILMNIFR